MVELTRVSGCIVCHFGTVTPETLLAGSCDYKDLGGDYFVQRDADRARQRAVAQLEALGYLVTLQPVAAA